MTGRIKMYNESRGFGFIVGEDGKEYFFHISSVSSTQLPVRGIPVEFSTVINAKGIQAENIVFIASQSTKPTFILLNGTRIKLSNIKNYGLARGEQYFLKVYEHTTSGDNLFERVLVDRYVWNGLKTRVDYDTFSTMQSAVGRGATVYAYIKSWDGSIKQSQNFSMKKDSFIVENVVYLYVTTYQGDNFKFVEDQVNFNIYEKCKELDSYLL